MSAWFTFTLETSGINMSELLDGYVYERDIARYDRDYNVSTRSLTSIDLGDFGMDQSDEEFFMKDFGTHKNDADRNEKIKKYEEKGLHFKEWNDDYATFTKEWDKEVKDSLNYEPVTFGEQGRFLSWGNSRYRDIIDVAISKKFPDRVFHLQCWCDGNKIDEYYIQNGKVVKP